MAEKDTSLDDMLMVFASDDCGKDLGDALSKKRGLPYPLPALCIRQILFRMPTQWRQEKRNLLDNAQ
jgi:hypothetical protein